MLLTGQRLSGSALTAGSTVDRAVNGEAKIEDLHAPVCGDHTLRVWDAMRDPFDARR
jgi:hypothetical protein